LKTSPFALARLSIFLFINPTLHEARKNEYSPCWGVYSTISTPSSWHDFFMLEPGQGFLSLSFAQRLMPIMKWVNPNLLKTFDTSLFKKYGTTHLDKFNLSLGGVFTIMVLFKLGTLQLLKRSKESKISSLSNVSIDFFFANFQSKNHDFDLYKGFFMRKMTYIYQNVKKNKFQPTKFL
jgi:hypothetical protein